MTRSPTELEPEIEASRQALARDVAALKQRAAPRRLMGDAVEQARARGRRTGARLLKVASSRQVQLAVLGAILAGAAAWLLVRRREAATLPERLKAAIVRAPAEPRGEALLLRSSPRKRGPRFFHAPDDVEGRRIREIRGRSRRPRLAVPPRTKKPGFPLSRE